MKEQIINDIEVAINELADIKLAIEDGIELNGIDALDTLEFLSTAIMAIRKNIKEHFQLKEEE